LKKYNTIIIGSGHNGLVCASYLAKAGQKVLVLEASENYGGLARSRTFFPGYKANTASALNQFSEKISSELNLASFGFNQSNSYLDNIGLNSDQNHVIVKKYEVQGVSEKDIQSYKIYVALLRKFSERLRPFWTKSIPRLSNENLRDIMTFLQIGLRLRMMGKEDMREFLRVFSLPTRDLMDEFFESPLLKATLSWDALIGSSQAPRSPNNSILTMLYRMSGIHNGHFYIPDGGMDSLVDALVECAKNSGVELQSKTKVKKIVINENEDKLSTSGIVTDKDEKISADRIISAVDPKQTFISLVGTKYLEIEFSNRINRLRSHGYVAKLNLALSDEPSFSGLKSAHGRLIIASDMDKIEFAWDDAKYGQYSQEPVLEMIVPSLYSSSLAPEGKHVLSANVMYVPCHKENGWLEKDKSNLKEKIIDQIALYAPSIKEQILHAELLTPKDLESEYNLTGGHWHHGELALDQMLMMRPTYEAAQYKTPIDSLFLCSAGCHPGGGLMGAAGYNASQEILK
tara:strand:+ start:13520 stop:15064 length:1545 start_codon:yes stop_codon:yes gene_type:complete